jgi:bifunctional non-homologous end joining protein LigD
MGINDKSSVKVGLYLAENDTTSELVCVGNVTIPQGKPMPPQWSVIEVKYLYCHRGGSIFQTTYLRPRPELDPEDCFMGQLKYKSEEEDE